MNLPIIKTKLYVPKLRSKIVDRTKLLKRLDANTECKLILISAPADFGKTTLISEWITNSNFSHTWLSLEDKDNDLIRFLSYFICALQVTKKNICSEVLEMLPLIKSIGLDSK